MLEERSGQQMTEFTVLLGIVAAVAIGMQVLVRQSINAGIKETSDFVLGPAPIVDPSEEDFTVLDRDSTQTATEKGSILFYRSTTVTETSSSYSVLEDEN